MSVDASVDTTGDGAGARVGRGTAADAADPQLARHVAELRSRLRPVCRDWDEATFEVLVLIIAQSKVRWAEAGYGD